MHGMVRRVLSHTVARPYIRRELPGWGSVFRHVVGTYQREAHWKGRTATVADKRTGYELDLDLGWWSDRMTFFLGRWYDLGAQLVIDEHVHSGDTVIDVGANRGMFALYSSKGVGAKGRVRCFEPNPTCVAKLARTIHVNKISNIEVTNAGLSDRNETLDLFVPDAGADTGLGTFASYADGTEAAISSRLLVGDEALRGIRPNFIKIDVEGFEAKVIRGLTQTLRQHKPTLYMEMVPRHLERAGSSIAEVTDLMTGLGYKGRRVFYSGRHPSRCEYGEIDGRNCDVIWTAN